MPRQISPATTILGLKREAKRWFKAISSGDPEARARLTTAYHAAPETPVLRDVQHALAREYGYESWMALTRAVAAQGDPAAARPSRTQAEYEQLAADMVLAFDSRDEGALARLNASYQRSFSSEDLWAEVWRRVYAFRQRAFKGSNQYLQLSEAQLVIAQDEGFSSWDGLLRSITTGEPPVPAFAVEHAESRIAPRRQLHRDEWDALIAAIENDRITAIDGGGLLTDDVLARIADLDHVTSLSLGGSRQLTDEGVLHLARMPQLERLDLSEYPGGRLTDRGLDVLRHLPKLRVFEMNWQRGITDSGVANLRFCEELERVELMGSPTGDGAIEALQGKSRLRSFSSGRLVTDAGLALLKGIPRFRGLEPQDGDPDGDGARLLIDGPFTDAGLASLKDLGGVVDLDLFWHVTGITSRGFAHLVDLPQLKALGADGKLSDDAALLYIGMMPALRRLRIQESIATDAGFEALSRSATIEGIWGRECPHFRSRGFIALSSMPSLRALGIGLKNVDTAALARLPHFPSLRELTPIGLHDDGFVSVGQCERLERLTCMYCRETTDAATAHINDLRLKYYYAGLTKISDRSLEILGGMSSLEQVELYECNGVTDAGLVFLAALPNLREVHLDSLPGVTLKGTRVFPERVRVMYTT